jgi:hypothetical protein
MSLPDELLVGAIDLHVHAGPHLRSSPRRADPVEVAHAAAAAGMRAIVLMDVFKESAGVAWMVRRLKPGVDVFGGIILNTVYGGLNPRAVKTALNYGAGATFVSFGAHSTRYLAEREGRVVDGVPTPFHELDPAFRAHELGRSIAVPLDGPLPSELDEILDLIAGRPDVVLNTGHVSGAEALRLVELARARGIERILVAHVARRQLTVEEQRAAAAQGAMLEATFSDYVYPSGVPRTHYYVEREYRPEVLVGDGPRRESLLDLKRTIAEVGVEHLVLASDYGIRATPAPVEGMRQFIACLLDMEMSSDDIATLVARNPARLLGIDAA